MQKVETLYRSKALTCLLCFDGRNRILLPISVVQKSLFHFIVREHYICNLGEFNKIPHFSAVEN